MHVDDALVAEVAVVPDPLEQGPAAEHVPGDVSHLAQQAELGHRQVHLLLTAAKDARRTVEDQRAVRGIQDARPVLPRHRVGRHGGPHGRSTP